MKIGIIGSGTVGQQLGIGLTWLGHEVKIGTRDTSKLNDWLKQGGKRTSAGSNKEAAQFGEIIILCTKWSGITNAINLAGKDNFTGKIILDVTNPLISTKGSPPQLDSSPGNSAGERVQQWFPDSRVVKGFNIIGSRIMIAPKREEGDPDLYICGNDPDAKNQIIKFAEGWGWKNIIDLGDISESYLLEALAMIWIIYGFKTNIWSHAFKLLKK